MSWNYRIMSHNKEYYAVHEVYYDSDNKVNGYTSMPINVIADTPEELKSVYKMIGEAFKKPILEYEK